MGARTEKGRVWLLYFFFILFFGICAFGVTFTIQECPNEDEPQSLYPFSSGNAVLQVELDNPALNLQSRFPLLQSLVVWSIFEVEKGIIRIDIPNPELASDSYNSTNIPFPFFASIFLDLPKGNMLIAVPSNATCYKIEFPKQESFFDSFCQGFTFLGTENVNSFAAYKWSRSIALVGSFVYYETCDSRRVPLQIHFLPSPILTGRIEETLKPFFEFTSSFLSTSPNLQRKLVGMITEHQMKSIGVDTVWQERSEEQNYKHPNFSLPFSFSRPSSSSPYSTYEDPDEYDHSYDDSGIEDDGTDDSPYNEDEGDSRNQSHKDFFASRMAFLHWVNTGADPKLFVPPLYCAAPIIVPTEDKASILSNVLLS